MASGEVKADDRSVAYLEGLLEAARAMLAPDAVLPEGERKGFFKKLVE